MAYYRRPRTSTKRSRYSRPKRQNVWVRYFQSGLVAGSNQNHGIDLIPPSIIDPGAVVGSTIVRSRGSFNVNAGAVTSAYGGFIVGAAILDRADTIESQPQPYANANDVDWMFWRFYSLGDPECGVFSNATEANVSISVDLKAQRKLHQPSDTLIAFIQPVSITSNPVPAYNASFSTLLKLS